MSERLASEASRGLIIRSCRGGDWTAQVGDETVACRLPGRLKSEDDPLARLVVGDRVMLRRFADEPERGVIEAVEPRCSVVGRGRFGKPPQLVAANLDQIVVVIAAHEPEPSLHTIDRYLALAAVCGLPAVLVVNKIDLDDDGDVRAEIDEVYEPLTVALVYTSAEECLGLGDLAARLRGHISAVIGPSGVGKSSLLNALNPGYALRCGEVMAIGKGRHTTTESTLLPLECGGWVADTPGIKSIGLVPEQVDPRDLQHLFEEFEPYLGDCRFADCAHRSEPGCAIDAAAEAEEIAESRLDSYRRLYDEIEAARRPW